MDPKKKKVFYQKVLGQRNLHQLPCKHFVDMDELPNFINQLLEKGTCTFCCSLCTSSVLSWQTIRSLLNPVHHPELEMMERQLQKNSRNMSHPFSTCPQCDRMVQRDSDSLCVLCPQCPGSDRQDYRFCWDCRSKWTAPPDSPSCSEECRPRELLRSCPTINVPHSAVHRCPTVRKCPACHALLSHQGGCNDIICPLCGCVFCYRCLVQDIYHEPFCTIVPN